MWALSIVNKIIKRNMKNSYKIVKKIGEGENGSIYLVEHPHTGDLLAMKKVVYSCFTNSNEIRLLPSLKHPNIIKIIEQQENQTEFTIYQEYATQGDLYSYSQRQFNGIVPQNILTKWLCQIALGLYYLHAEVRVLHRDIKSRNILVMSNGLVKIADFGASRQLLKNEDFAITAVGTPYYLSPQAVGSSKYNSKSDVWGLGCIMFELSTGKKPFEGNSLNDLIKRILNDEVQEISQTYSTEFREMVGGMLQKNMDKRISIQSILEQQLIKQAFHELKQEYEEQYRDFVYPVITELKTKKYSEREEYQKIGFINESIKTVKNEQKEKSLKLDILGGWAKDRAIKVQRNIIKVEDKPKKVEHSKYKDRSLKFLIEKKKAQKSQI